MAKNRGKVWRRSVAAAKVEATTGTEVTLAADDYLECFDLKLTFDNTFTTRKGVGLGQMRGAPGAQSGGVVLTTELRNSGTETLPLSALMLTGAGLKNTDGVFTPQTAADVGDTFTIGDYRDGKFKSLAGVMFDLKITAEVGKPIYVEWTGKGKRQIGTPGPKDVTMIAAAPLSGKPPVAKGMTVTLGGTAYRVSKVEITINNGVTLRPDVNDPTGYVAAQCADRVISVKIDPESQSVTAKNWHADYENATEAQLVVVVGSGTDGTVTITCPKLQQSEPHEDTDGSGIWRDALTFQANEDEGDDEITIAYT